MVTLRPSETQAAASWRPLLAAPDWPAQFGPSPSPAGDGAIFRGAWPDHPGRRLNVREPSAILKSLMSTERAASSKAPGPGVIPMHTGDPDFPTPAFIAEALNDAVERGYTHYGAFQGDPELRAVIAEQLSKRSGTSWSGRRRPGHDWRQRRRLQRDVRLSQSRRSGLIPDPNFSQYADVATMIGAEATYVQQTSDFHLDLDRLKAAAGPRAKMVDPLQPVQPDRRRAASRRDRGARRVVRRARPLDPGRRGVRLPDLRRPRARLGARHSRHRGSRSSSARRSPRRSP